MKNHILAVCLTLVLMAGYLGYQTQRFETSAAVSYVQALPTTSQVYVDGKKVKFQAYNIKGNNYFKARDIAMALNGSPKQFDISQDSANNAINIRTGSPYTPIGGELSISSSASSQNALLSTAKIYVNGVLSSITAYNIKGYNYCKLRDFGSGINFGVTWNGALNRIDIDTSENYGELFYVSKSGSDSNPGTMAQPWKTVQKAANMAKAGDTVYIRAGTYNERVIIKNSGTSVCYITFTNYPGEIAIIDGTNLFWGRTGALVDISGKSYLRIKGIKVQNSSWVGIGAPLTGTHHIVIEKCATYRTQASGINISFSNNIIIDGNTIDTPNLYPQDEGLTLGVVDTFEIKNNTIINAQKECLDVKDGCKNGKIYNNTIRNGVGVGIYVDAFSKTSDSIEIYANTISNVSYGICLANEAGGILTNINVHDNFIYDSPFGMGIGFFMQNYPHPMSNIIFNHNTLSGITLRGVRLDNPEAKRVVITNNTLGGTKTCVPIYLNGGNLAETYIDGNALNRIVQGQPTGSNYTLL